MLFPQNNRLRNVIDLSGIWQLKADKDNVGEEKKWFLGFEPDAPVGIPGSWNEQLAERGLMHYTGTVWLKTNFFIPSVLKEKDHFLRFGSADFNAKIWINGRLLGEHKGGFLPFEFNIKGITDIEEENILVVKVDNVLTNDSIPQGFSQEDHLNSNRSREQTYPLTAFDFLPYGGLPRPVKIIFLEALHIKSIQTDTKIDKTHGLINFSAEMSCANADARLNLSIFEGESNIFNAEFDPFNTCINGQVLIENCQFWSPQSPVLYRMQFKLIADGHITDEYNLDVGVREIEVDKDTLLLNGKPVFLKGFGKHEDFDIIGKGLSYPLLVKDFELMKWIGANSFRTSHYPYAEEVLQMADKYGFLVVDEVPAVGLNFKYVTQQTLKNHKQYIHDLIQRDRNHPCVISWCLGNEPGIWGELEANSDKADIYWSDIFDYARDLDASRPLTVPAFPRWRENDLVFKYSDFISINRYWGWYEIPAELDKAECKLKNELNLLYQKYEKPILVTEFGADTIEGEHATYPQMFTEEFQTNFIMKYFNVIESMPFTIGEHVWNFADFMTAQHFRRVVLNKKGVFTRQRHPKSAAFAIREHWTKESAKMENNNKDCVESHSVL